MDWGFRPVSYPQADNTSFLSPWPLHFPPMASAAQQYLAELQRNLSQGDATEHTHRPALKAFLEAVESGITATNEPKRAVDCGAPDYNVWRGTAKLGIVEAKDVGESLPKVEKSEQLTRYRKAFPNLILTDYLEFRWYVNGELRQSASLGTVDAKGRIVADSAGAQAVPALLAAFCRHESEFPASPGDLAKRMAELGKLIRVSIESSLAREGKDSKLQEQLGGFRDVLLHDLTAEQFADMYAQTICYGLFAARCWIEGRDDPRKFSRATAADMLPKTNPFLRKVFGEIAGADLDEGVRWAVDDVALLLRRSRMADVLKDFGKRTRQEDPVVHFYETFLAAYDPAMREARGVYYTPEPVVSYITRSVDHILRTDFGLPDGLADSGKVKVKDKDGNEAESHRVLILDPATGTGTFLHGVIDEIHGRVTEKHGKGVWSQYVREHLLPRLFGFELLMAPYAVAHMKLGIQLNELGYDFSANERLGVFLTNTLEEARKVSDLLFARWLSDEAKAASAIKRDLPIMVVLGNPPYSGHSENKGEWITNLLRGKDTLSHAATGNYFECDGKPLGERQVKWLHDDYVKFIRFAQWRIEQTGHGVLAFISNNGYLDNPTFRGMRQSLMETFDDIYVLDLHGNSKKKERAPDGGPDENVFDIQQGVCIGLFVKRRQGKSKRVMHCEILGDRANKYAWLNKNYSKSTKWSLVSPRPAGYNFTPANERRAKEYGTAHRLPDLMPLNTVGIVAARDHLAIAFTADELVKKMHRFMSMSPEEARHAFDLGQDARDWKVADAQADVASSGVRSKLALPVTYRPFDVRSIYYTGQSRGIVGQPQRRVMQHFTLGTNIGLVCPRAVEIGRPWEHLMCVSTMAQHHAVSLKEANYVFPLYLYENGEVPASLFDHENGRRPNLSAKFIADVEAKLGKVRFIPEGTGDLKKTFGPEDVFHYIYAIFHAPSYRARYAEFLKIDFPRVPLTSSLKLFRGLCAIGARLVALHLMDADGPRKFMPKFPVDGDNLVEKVSYNQPEQRVWINGRQYFAPVPPAVWAFHIGGYRVAEKWLKDRKDRKLGFDDLDHYCRIIAALSETMQLMAELDQAIEAEGGWPLK